MPIHHRSHERGDALTGPALFRGREDRAWRLVRLVLSVLGLTVQPVAGTQVSGLVIPGGLRTASAARLTRDPVTAHGRRIAATAGRRHAACVRFALPRQGLLTPSGG